MLVLKDKKAFEGSEAPASFFSTFTRIPYTCQAFGDLSGHSTRNRYAHNYTNKTTHHAGRQLIMLSVVWTAQAI